MKKSMKKYINQEKNEMCSVEKESPKKAEVKSTLLQTYFTSLLSLVLCVTMFLGTSYAWFTSEVNNAGNEIYVGTLKVGLFKEIKTDAGTETQDLANNDPDLNYKLFDSSIRWEPGYTALETVQIVNQGDLAFNYVLSFTDGALAELQDADGQGAEGRSTEGQSAEDQSAEDQTSGVSLGDVAEYFEVWVFNHNAETNTETNAAAPYKAPASYTDINAPENGWMHVGTLAEVLAGKSVLSGNIADVRKTEQEASAINAGTTDGKAASARHTIALHMKEGAGSEVMGRKISLNVKLVAYQMTSEPDGFGNSAYDKNLTPVADVKELKEALASGKTAVLSSDIELQSMEDRVSMTDGMLDGNGKTITYNGERDGESSVGVLTTSGGKISNLTIDGNDNGRALYVTKLTSDLQVSDCTFDGVYSFNLNSAEKNDNAVVNFNDTIFRAWTSYANVAQHVYFTDCTFEGVLRPYGDTTLTNCSFTTGTDTTETATTGTLDISKLESGETITLINCTYNGQLIEKAVVKCEGEAITCSECDVIGINDKQLLVLKDNE